MSVTSTSGTQSITQSAWKALQLEQAKQFAQQAAQNARAMQSQASAAQSEASRAQQNALTIKIEADQAQNVAVQADRGVRSAQASNQIGPEVVRTVAQAAQITAVAQTVAVAQTAAPTPVKTAPQPSVNTQGETVGTVINVTA
jgi:hypothetical protein